MQLNPLGNGPVAGVPGAQGQDKTRGAEGDTAPSSSNIIQPGPGDQGNANGVMRLLQDGHFQGVAGVRLQINFQEQLAGIAQQSVASTADAGADSILAAVDTVVAEFTANNELDPTILEGITTAQQTFNETATVHFEEFQSGAIGSAELLTSLQTAFDNFLASIEAIVPTGETETDGGDAVEINAVIPTGGDIIPLDTAEALSEETATATEPDFTALLQGLSDAFSGALHELETSLASAQSTATEISEPNGNGVAFAKFMDILSVLNGESETAETSTPVPEIDTAV